MLLNERPKDLARLKEVKVRIPMSHHIKLHSMKVLTGKQISDAVTEALEVYFRTNSVGPTKEHAASAFMTE